MEELTPPVFAGLTASIALMIPTALWPEWGWMFGAVLTAVGVLSLIFAYLNSSEFGSLFGILTFCLGLAVEFAPLDLLVTLLVIAAIIDLLIVVVSGLSEAIADWIDGLF
jgi:hypothetical protein